MKKWFMIVVMCIVWGLSTPYQAMATAPYVTPVTYSAAYYGDHPCHLHNQTTCDILIWCDSLGFSHWPAGQNSTDFPGLEGFDFVDYVRLRCQWYKLEGQLFPWSPYPSYEVRETYCGSNDFEVYAVVDLGLGFYAYYLVPPVDCLPKSHPAYTDDNWCPTSEPGCPPCPDARCPCDGDPDPGAGGGDPVPDPNFP